MHETAPQEPPKATPLLRRLAPLAVLLAGLATAYGFGLHEYLSLDMLVAQRDALRSYVDENTATAALAFVGAYALAVALSFPAASILTVFSGFLFGWLGGGVLTAIAATLGATAIFTAARYAFADALRKRAGPRVAKLGEGFRKNAFTYLLVLRLAPVFPFFVINVAPALFNVRLATYVGATFLGILPGTFAYAFLGQGLDSVVQAAAAAGREVSLGDIVTPQITIAFFCLALVAAVPVIVTRLRRSA